MAFVSWRLTAVITPRLAKLTRQSSMKLRSPLISQIRRTNRTARRKLDGFVVKCGGTPVIHGTKQAISCAERT
jgi:hypothetical protein